MNFQLSGSCFTSSSSNRPVMSLLAKVLYAATTPSKAPLRHSSMNSERLVARGEMSSAVADSESQSLRAGSLGAE